MPRYVGYTPNFEPISLQDYLAVPTTIIGEYAKAEDKFEEYQDKAAQLQAMIGEDPYGLSIINNYRNQTEQVADAISNGGIQNAEELRQALSVRKYYRDNLMPLEVGIPYWEQYKKSKLALGENPLEDDLTLESFVRNPTQDYILTKGSDVRNVAASMAKAISERRIKDPKSIGKVHDGSYYRDMSEKGFSDTEIQDWIAGRPNSELDSIRDEIYRQFGHISPNKLDRFINEGVVIGATYDKKFEDKAVRDASTTGSFTGDLSNYIDFSQLYNNDVNGRTASFNVFRPSNVGGKNGNIVDTQLDDGTVRLKSAKGILGAMRTVGLSNNGTTELLHFAQDLAKTNSEIEELYKSLPMNNFSDEYKEKEAKLADAVLEEIMFHRNEDGTLSINTYEQYRNKVPKAFLSHSTKHYNSILKQLQEGGVDLNTKYNSVPEALGGIENTFNSFKNFKNKGRINSIRINIGRKAVTNILQSTFGDWEEIDSTGFDNEGTLSTKTKVMDSSDKKILLDKMHNGTIGYTVDFISTVQGDYPDNYYIISFKDGDITRRVKMSPNQFNRGETTDYDTYFDISDAVGMQRIYEEGTPEELANIGASNRMSLKDIDEKFVKVCIENNINPYSINAINYKKAPVAVQQMYVLRQQYYKNAHDAGYIKAIQASIDNLYSGIRLQTTYIDELNENTQNADRNLKH